MGSDMLTHLFEHIRAADERSEKMASQIDDIWTTLECGVLGPNSVGLAVAPPATPVQPPPVTRPHPPSQKRFHGPPGIFHPSVPDTVHKPLQESQFHVSCSSSKSSMLTSMLVKDKSSVQGLASQG